MIYFSFCIYLFFITFCFFFFNDTATTEIYTLSLHDALPISVATGDVIQQGGSRRGALMLMLDDDHPDVEEFITVKQDLRRINHANLSVCVSDAFMDAVRRDGDWELKWQGEVNKTPKSRHPRGLF